MDLTDKAALEAFAATKHDICRYVGATSNQQKITMPPTYNYDHRTSALWQQRPKQECAKIVGRQLEPANPEVLSPTQPLQHAEPAHV